MESRAARTDKGVGRGRRPCRAQGSWDSKRFGSQQESEASAVLSGFSWATWMEKWGGYREEKKVIKNKKK